jgi:uncharacterized membrane protein
VAAGDSTRDPEPLASALTVAHVVYGLHAFAILVGIAGSATVVGSFLMSLPSILAVVLNYVKRGDARGSWLESHYRWQIRTFWYAFTWWLGALLLFVTLVGIPLALAVLLALSAWLVYRVGRGWLRLRDRLPMYTD